MSKAKEISALWKQIKPQIGELARLCHEIESHAEVTADAYQRGYEAGLNDAWEAARKIACDRAHGGFHIDTKIHIFGAADYAYILANYNASEAVEKIRVYEQEKGEQKEEDSVFAEDVMRQYLDTFCKGQICKGCPLNTPDFTCGRGRHFLTSSPVSNEEVRRAYTTVLRKMKGEN